MKTLIFSAVAAFASATLFAGLADESKTTDNSNVIQVTASVEAEQNGMKASKALKEKAKEVAVMTYIRDLNVGVTDDILEKAVSQVDNFIEKMPGKNADFMLKAISPSEWNQIDETHGELGGKFEVPLDIAQLNQFLDREGISIGEEVEFILLEECPTLASMKVDEAFGKNMGEGNFFVQNYTTFQRNIRNALIKECNAYGLKINLLADNDLYDEYKKTKDDPQVGVYFNVNDNEFSIDEDLLRAVKDNNPDTIVLFYGIEHLIYETPEAEGKPAKLRAKVVLNVKNLANNETKSIGDAEDMFMSSSKNADGQMADFATCVQRAIKKLLASENAGQKINSIAMSLRNKAARDDGPMKVTINAGVFEAANRKKALFMLKKSMTSCASTKFSNVKTTNNSLTATVERNDEITDVETLYFEVISGMLEEIGLELDDDKVNFNSKSNLIIKP